MRNEDIITNEPRYIAPSNIGSSKNVEDIIDNGSSTDEGTGTFIGNRSLLRSASNQATTNSML